MLALRFFEHKAPVAQLSHQSGFSLVELAISVVVIGVLLGLVAGGVGLLDTSRIAATVTQIDKIQKSVSAFRDTYHAMPGDFNRATTTINNCIAALSCGNGDGNGAVGTGTSLDHDWNDVVNDDDETLYVWRHLALSEIMPEASGLGDALAWGNSHPRSNFGGGVEMFYDSAHSFLDFSYGGGHFLRYSDELSSSDLDDGEGVLALSARGVDRKLDDGDPFIGRVTAAGNSSGDCYNGEAIDAFDDYQNAQDDLSDAQAAYDAAVLSGSAPAIASAQNDLDAAQATFDDAASDYAELEDGYNTVRFGSPDCFLFIKLGP